MERDAMSAASRRRARGITLLEMMTAALLGVVIILALGKVDVTRIYLSDQVRRASSSHTEAALAMTQMVRQIQRADRIIVDTGSESVQVRIPTGGPSLDFDQPGSYEWLQFRRDSATGQLVQFAPASTCTVAARYGNCSTGTNADDACFTQFALRYQDEAPAPPGGDPNPQDNNLLELELIWKEPKSGRTQRYLGQANLRAGAYTDMNAQNSGGVMDSGTGLAPGAVASPPPGC
jgi:hypothetical protein